MPSICIDFALADQVELRDLLCQRWGYQDNVVPAGTTVPVPNPEARGAFVKRRIAEYVKAEAHFQRCQNAAVAATATVTPIEVT
jgi:hypothetical protein